MSRSAPSTPGSALTPRLVLASGSPRRRELLGHLGYAFDVVIGDVDETPLTAEDPERYVERLAGDKSAAGLTIAGERANEGGLVVIGADTTVAVDGEILAKPVDVADAARMLRLLSGRTHQVHTGVAVLRAPSIGGSVAGGLRSLVVTTAVEFVALSPADIDEYVATGEPLDKAGAYAIQGIASQFVRAVHGSVTNVIGLPLAETRDLLRVCGLPPTRT